MAKVEKKKSNRRLGKGLGGLLHQPVEIIDPASPAASDPKHDSSVTVKSSSPRLKTEEGGLVQLPVDCVAPNPRQPRQVFDDDSLGSLADSIKQAGLMQPIVVRNSASGYEIIAGERRWRAAVSAGYLHRKLLSQQSSEKWYQSNSTN